MQVRCNADWTCRTTLSTRVCLKPLLPVRTFFVFCELPTGVMMKKSRLVMIGNGMAGVRALEELLKIAPELYDITVFGAEPHPNYNRILLSPVLAGEQTLDEIILNDWSWYKDNNITLHAGWTVTDVDRVHRVVHAQKCCRRKHQR